MRIVAITHYPGALRCFIDTAAHLDRTVPGWGGLTLFDSGQPLGDADALAGGGLVRRRGFYFIVIKIKQEISPHTCFLIC